MAASIAKVGTEIRANTAIKDFQTGSKTTGLVGGNFVVTWIDFSAGVGGATGDAAGLAVKAQVFNSAGTKLGTEILVNTATAGDQSNQQILALSGGGFVVIWNDLSLGVGGATGDGTGSAVKAQRFDASGNKVGTEIRVNTATAGNQPDPTFTALANDGWVATWTDESQSVGGAGGDNDLFAIKGQVYGAGGALVGTEFLVNTAIKNNQSESKVVTLDNGGFVVTWLDNSLGVGGPGGDTSFNGISAQVFTAAGAKVGTEIRVNTATDQNQSREQIIALKGANAGVVVVLEVDSHGVGGATGDTSGAAIKLQVFTQTGAKVGTEIRPNVATMNAQELPKIAALSNGGFVVAWTDQSGGVGGATGDTSAPAVKMRVYAADGTAVTTEIRVNTAVDGEQSSVQIKALDSGVFVLTWNDTSSGVGGATGDTFSFAVKGQVYLNDGTPIGGEFLVNTAVQNNQVVDSMGVIDATHFVVSWTDLSAGVGGATGDNDGLAIKAQVFAVTGLNTPPAGLDKTVTVGSLAPRVLTAADFAFTDGEGNSLAGVKITTLPGAGQLKNNGVAVVAGATVSATDINAGKLTYTSTTTIGGTTSFTFQVQDNGGGTDIDLNPNTITLKVGVQPLIDFNANRFSDLLFQHDLGSVVTWTMNGAVMQNAIYLGNAGTDWHVRAGADMDGDGDADLLWQKDNGDVVVWTMNGTAVSSTAFVANSPLVWHFKDTGDFNGDGKADILWQKDDSTVSLWTMNGAAINGLYTVSTPGVDQHAIAAADFNADGKADIVLQKDDGTVVVWTLNGAGGISSTTTIANPGTTWHVKDAFDFNNDGQADIVLQNDNGSVALWTLNNLAATGAVLGNPGLTWHVKQGGDFNHDGLGDIALQADNGNIAIWTTNGSNAAAGAVVTNPGADWHLI